IYADYNATSPVSEQVVREMEPFVLRNFGNASRVSGEMPTEARLAIEAARRKVAELVDADPAEVVFVSGGTESCNHAILGAVADRPQRRRLIYSNVEHPAVRETAIFAAGPLIGRTADELPIADIASSICGHTSVVSSMLANNEVGQIYDLSSVVVAARGAGATVHTDATQAVGRIPVSFRTLGVDLLSFSGHKLGGPKGIGVLVVRKDADWQPVARGGGQEGGRRGGTQAVSLIVGLGEAAGLALARLRAGESERLAEIRNTFEQSLAAEFPQAHVIASNERRLPNTSAVTLPGVLAQDLVEELARKEVYISSGAACRSETAEPSRVLLALGLSTAQALSTIRVSFGTDSTMEDAQGLASLIAAHSSASRLEVEQSLLLKRKSDSYDEHV
ncbi:MAG: aminotransferase class V-fold PLP-dependent enzyme, partial [Planctomycetales bacterium]|nr:aminotransferase class V-fold PLP-dependent enzyme [Planctomycetales bacterium]